MNKDSRNFLFFFIALHILVLFPITLRATHIVGGDLNYKYLGNNQYEIRLSVFRDCYNGIPPFDNPASLGIFDNFNNLVFSIDMTFLGSDTIPPTINSPCFIPPTNICYERTTYIDTITLLPNLNGYQLAYQRCCRNYTILNIQTPDAVGATYYASIPSTAFGNNSNPTFVNWPPPFICLGLPFTFDHSAIDIDGDSIVYEICTPYIGADTTIPTPSPPFSPPYSTVTYQPPFNNANLLGGVPLTIDRFTGELNATPNTVGQFVVGICAYEFRNGVFLSVTKRDFQLNVVPCPTYVVAAIQNPIINCRTNEVTFKNFSFGAGSYKWDFGDNSASNDTSLQTSPTYIYPDTGTYTVTLIAYSQFNPLCADTAIGTVTILPEYEASFTFTKDTCTNFFSFNDSSNTISGITSQWFWTFGDGANAYTEDPNHLYPFAGNYSVNLYATSNRGCIDTVTFQVEAKPILTVNINSASNPDCYNECDGNITATPVNGVSPYSYIWNDPLNQSTAVADSLCAGIYFVTITDSLGCIATESGRISQPDSLTINAESTVAYCKGACIGTASVTIVGGNGNNQYAWSDPNTQTTAIATQLCQGNYFVTVTDAQGCTAIDSVTVVYSDSLPFVEANANPDTIYQGQTAVLSSNSLSNYSYQWDPTISLSNPNQNTTNASPSVTTTYVLTVIDQNQCRNSDTTIVNVLEVFCKEPEIFIPTAFSPNNDSQNDVLLIRGNSIESLEFAIYDRWGEKVFETSQKQVGWDGLYKGKQVFPGVYAYYLKVICYSKEVFEKKGNITLIR